MNTNNNAMPYFAHPSAVIDPGARIGVGCKIWHFCHLSDGCELGAQCVLGQNVFVATGVKVGAGTKVQNNVSLYSGTVIEEDVFLGPSCVLTNVLNPRSEVRRKEFFETTTIRRGATVGANATIVCGTEVGRFAFIGAGAVVTKNVPDYGFILGVPGKQVGWMSRHGHPLSFDSNGLATCKESGLRYVFESEIVRGLDLAEDDEMPSHLKEGKTFYREVNQS